ncbi:hypothetical protein [Corynebacterium provencense]|uniref:hypothetical protein n=1 Tax=Corynebacterium provencense TaxID=1737425 RepID=UPI0008344BC1|nr:hypothetical protein [Corynebacterium provencense]
MKNDHCTCIPCQACIKADLLETSKATFPNALTGDHFSLSNSGISLISGFGLAETRSDEVPYKEVFQ